MSQIRLPHVIPASGDTVETTLQKMLQRLNDSSTATPGVPAANVSVVNAPLTVQEINPLTEIDIGNWPATQDVSVLNWPASQTIDGAVSVTNFPASQNVAVTNAPNVGVNNWPAHQPVHLYDPVTDEAAIIDHGHLDCLSTPIEFEIAEVGQYQKRDAAIYRVLGRRAGFNSTSVLQDIGEWLSTSLDVFPTLTGLESLEVVSSSAQDDDGGGTGTHKVKIVYLDTSYAMQLVEVTLDGTNPVAVVPKMLFVYWMEASDGGSGEVSAGNIDLRVTGTGVIHERITAGGNRSLSARFMIPDGYVGLIKAWGAEAIATSQDVRLRATVCTYCKAVGTRYIFKALMYLAAGGNRAEETQWIYLPARTLVKVSTMPGAAPAGNRVGCHFDIILVAD